MPGAQNPFDQIAGIDTVDPVAKGDFRSWAKQRTAQVIADANELRTFDLSGQMMVFFKSNGRTYKLDTTDTTTADDGVTCIRDFNGLAFKIVTINGVDGADGSDPGVLFTWDTGTTDADPGSGNLRANNASLASATFLYISKTNRNAEDVSAFLAALDDSTNTSVKGTLVLTDTTAGTQATFATGAVTDASGYIKLAVSGHSGDTSFADGDGISFQFSRTGDKGADGANGSNGANGTDPGLRWLFDSSTSMADPGPGDLRLNNATLSSVTAIAISDNTGETGNPSADAFIATWDDSTTTALRGFLLIKKSSAPQNFAIYSITAALTDNSTWWQITVSHIASAGSFSNTDVLSVQFYRTGNAGAGSGDLLAANNLSDLASPHAGFDNISVHGADVASAATLNLDTATGDVVDVTGTTTITAITLSEGRRRLVRFTGILTLTNGASLVLPEGEDIKTQVGSYALFIGYATGVVRCAFYTPTPRAMFSAHKNGTDQTGIADVTFTLVTWPNELFDKGGFFASDGWTPPKGKVHMQAELLVSGTFTTGNQLAINIYKNGAGFKQHNTMASSVISGGGVFIAIEDDANGSDVYTVRVYADVNSGTATVAGNTNNTLFTGFWIGP